MNQQNQGSGPPSNVPMKRKRGRPRKDEGVVQRANVPVMPGFNNVLNSNQTAGTTDNKMVGKAVTGVIDGTFKSGYLLSCKVADTDAFLRGLVFLPGQVSPLTVGNDVAPHVKMIERKEIPIPVVNPQAEIHGSVPSSVQCSKQSFEPELQQVPMSEEQVLPTEIRSGISSLLENQSASTLIPNSISNEEIPQGTQEPGHVNQSTIMSELDHDKTVKQSETLHELDASTEVKESSADGGETKVSEAASELINLVPPIENANKELGTGQQAVPYAHQLNEPNTSTIEFNLIPVSAEPEALPIEQTTKTVNYFVEKQELPKTDVLEDTKTKLVSETSCNVDTSNSNGKPSTDVVNIPVVGSNHKLETSQPESMPSEQIGKSVPSESKFSSD